MCIKCVCVCVCIQHVGRSQVSPSAMWALEAQSGSSGLVPSAHRLTHLLDQKHSVFLKRAVLKLINELKLI